MAEHAAWSIQPVPLPDGRVDLDIAVAGIAATITLTREESRTLARAILAAGGDATERTLGRVMDGRKEGEARANG